tara:strand:- start:257 stop:877 length:621 start_codon:yes stop_codon:yes gene_type:complete
MEQRTAEWFQARLGKVTASNIDTIISKVRSGESSYKRKYRMQLVTERLTGRVVPVFVNAAMQHGVDYEDEARNLYIERFKLLKDVDVKEEGLVDHPRIPMSAASPDGLVGDDGLIEIKCPQPLTHTETLMSHNIDQKYIHQMQWQLACTERQWCDFVSYHPEFPDEHKLFVKRVERDDELIARLEVEVEKFLIEVADAIKFINEEK